MQIPIDKIIDCQENVYLVTAAAMKRSAIKARYIDQDSQDIKQLDIIAESISDVLEDKIKVELGSEDGPVK
jgi:hypothetical protein